MASERNFKIVIHGGAGVIAKSLDGTPYSSSMKKILENTFSFANKSNATCVDIAEYAVKQLENNELFNAGKGAVFTAEGTHELDASIMNGSNLQIGAVSLITNIKNPISAARVIMEVSEHNLIAGRTAEIIAASHDLETVSSSYYFTQKRYDQLLEAKRQQTFVNDHDLEDDLYDNHIEHEGAKGTVGCVCYLNGNIVAATSTGGMTNKIAGRIGDSPIIGAGTYANNSTCAVSCTGKGEEFMRYLAAYDVSARMEYGQKTLIEASNETVFNKLPIGSGGLIAIDCHGNHSMPFNTPGMFRGFVESNGNGAIGIWEDLEEFHV